MTEQDKSESTAPKECPICELLNPPAAQLCDCGYNFQKQSIEKSFLDQVAKDGVRGNKRSDQTVAACVLAVFQAVFFVGMLLVMGFSWMWTVTSDAQVLYLNMGFIDAALLIIGAAGVWFGRWQFALLLVVYQTANVCRFAVGTLIARDLYWETPSFPLIATLIAVGILVVFWSTYLSLKPLSKNG